MRINSLYLQRRSLRQGAPLLIYPLPLTHTRTFSVCRPTAR